MKEQNIIRGTILVDTNTIAIGLDNNGILSIMYNKDVTKPLHPYELYTLLENTKKNAYNNTKIIEKIKTSNFIEYHFNYGLILEAKGMPEADRISFNNLICFSYDIIGDSNSIPDDELSELTQDYGYEKQPYRSIFKKEVYIRYGCFERVRFSHCEFESKLTLYRLEGSNEAIEFHNGINFEHCVFGGEVEFRHFVSGSPLPENKYYNNARKTNFKNCIFKKRVDFSNSKICNNIYFNNSIFQDSVDFHECEFEKTACFYGVKFDKAPNFSQTQFKGSLNVVNTNLDFDFESLDKKIRKEYETYNHITLENKENLGYIKRFFKYLISFFTKASKDTEKYQKPLEHFANDFRDSFRILKNALIKDNNLLNASNFHKYELYSKEIELDSKKTKTIKDKVEKWQLWFYRKLCDHHTDLVLNLKWLVYTIALYVLLLGKIPSVYPVAIVAIFIFCVYVYMRGFKNVWLIVSSAIVFITILDTPKIILGISNLFEKDLNPWQNFITTLYVIAIGLVLFSLQKTARKNSIVPN
ncbi:MAG: pentapeptide repeat-containing protein [Helicobacter sp.]|nr:pentapeptide repeat-containing protein [Helicobacter sp.]